MRVAVIGSNGQLGADVVAAFERRGDEVTSLTHAEIELSSFESVRDCLCAQDAGFVVNTAAMHHVEKCEQDPEKAFAVNAVGARNLALATSESGSVLVHVSTDYVFDGSKGQPYVETDAPLPLNVYGNSKLAGEYFVRTLNPKHYVIRTSAIYGKHPCRAKGGLNFVELMLKLGRERGRVRVVDSEFVSPTPTADIARQIVALSDGNAYGLYHATAEGSCSWHEFAREIFATAKMPVQVDIADPSEFPAKVPRPSYSVLENLRLKDAGVNVFQPWEAGLAEYLGAAAGVLAS
ncbi:MAG: dTDP-4-dehydrorhamnose reductase [Terracidiphilus sp.]